MSKATYKVAGTKDLRAILEEQEYKCSITGEELTPENTAFDHIIPLSKGGNSEKNNLQAVERKVNVSKSEMGMQEYVDLCANVIRNIGSEYGYSLIELKKDTKVS